MSPLNMIWPRVETLPPPPGNAHHQRPSHGLASVVPVTACAKPCGIQQEEVWWGKQPQQVHGPCLCRLFLCLSPCLGLKTSLCFQERLSSNTSRGSIQVGGRSPVGNRPRQPPWTSQHGLCVQCQQEHDQCCWPIGFRRYSNLLTISTSGCGGWGYARQGVIMKIVALS